MGKKSVWKLKRLKVVRETVMSEQFIWTMRNAFKVIFVTVEDRERQIDLYREILKRATSLKVIFSCGTFHEEEEEKKKRKRRSTNFVNHP